MKVLRKIAKTLLRHQPSQMLSDADLEYLLWLSNLYLRIKNVPGHIAEVGVASGRNAIIFGKLIQLHGDSSVRQYIGFDTFNGYSERDLVRESELPAGAWKDTSLQRVMSRCEDNNVERLVDFVAGDAVATVPETLRSFKGKKFMPGAAKFALLYIDCNAYFPAKASMESFESYMSPGGYIVIDEKIQRGETKALCEFAVERGYKVERFGSNEVPVAVVTQKIT